MSTEPSAILGGVVLSSPFFALLFWNKFIRRRCSSCKSTKYSLVGEDEIDRWVGDKRVDVNDEDGKKIGERSISVTYKKIRNNYCCSSCSHTWSEEKTIEIGGSNSGGFSSSFFRISKSLFKIMIKSA